LRVVVGAAGALLRCVAVVRLAASVGRDAATVGLPETLGMPLHAEDGAVVASLAGLDDAVGRQGADAHAGCGLAHGLVVEAVDEQAVGAVDVVEERVGRDVDAVGGQCARRVLRMLDAQGGVLAGEVLHDGAAERGREQLQSAADAEDGNLSVGSQPHEEQLLQVAAGVDAAQMRRGLFADEQRVEVAAAAEDECVEGLEHADERRRVGVLTGSERWQQYGYAAFAQHGVVVGLRERGFLVLVVAGDADERAAVVGRQRGVEGAEGMCPGGHVSCFR
jgi:hypothetical protein